MIHGKNYTLDDMLTAVRRRWWMIALPFVLVFAILALCFLPFLPLVAIAALTDTDPGLGGNDLIEDVGSKVVGGYFGWFRRRRHPVFWGAITGVLVALALLAIIAYVRGAPDRSLRERN